MFLIFFLISFIFIPGFISTRWQAISPLNDPKGIWSWTAGGRVLITSCEYWHNFWKRQASQGNSPYAGIERHPCYDSGTPARTCSRSYLWNENRFVLRSHARTASGWVGLEFNNTFGGIETFSRSTQAVYWLVMDQTSHQEERMCHRPGDLEWQHYS